MNVLITGGAGYLGSYLTQRCLAMGWNVTVVDNLMYGPHSLFRLEKRAQIDGTTLALKAPLNFKPSHIRFENTDIRDKEAMARILSTHTFDALIHLAAIVGVKSCKENEAAAWEINYVASKDLYELAQRHHVAHFIFASTYSVYGNQNGVIVSENSPVFPVHMYETSKIRFEEFLQNSDGLPYTILRFATACGVSFRTRLDLLSNQLTVEAGRARRCRVFQKDDLRSFVHVADIAEAILTVLQAPKNKVQGECFNVGEPFLPEEQGYGKLSCSKEKLVHAIAESYRTRGITIETQYDDFSEDARNSILLAKKMKDALGFSPKHSLSDSINEIRDLVLNHRNPWVDLDSEEHFEKAGTPLLNTRHLR